MRSTVTKPRILITNIRAVATGMTLLVANDIHVRRLASQLESGDLRPLEELWARPSARERYLVSSPDELGQDQAPNRQSWVRGFGFRIPRLLGLASRYQGAEPDPASRTYVTLDSSLCTES